MPNIKRLIDNDGNEFYPRTVKAAISDLENLELEVTNTDPGAGQPLETGKMIAVVNTTGAVNNADIPNGTITADKLDKASFVNMFYPVGSIFMTASFSTVTQVQNALGGTWQAWGSGRVPVGVNSSDTDFKTVEKTGGVKTTYHVFPKTPINSNNFQNPGTNYWNSVTGDMNSYLTSNGQTALSTGVVVRNVGGSIGDNGSVATEVTYFKYTATNLQPYITCYMYKRTA